MPLQKVQHNRAKVCKRKQVPMLHLFKHDNVDEDFDDPVAHRQIGANGGTTN